MRWRRSEKISDMARYREMLRQTNSMPRVRLDYEVTPQPRFRIGGTALGAILLPLMYIDFLIQLDEFERQEHEPHYSIT